MASARVSKREIKKYQWDIQGKGKSTITDNSGEQQGQDKNNTDTTLKTKKKYEQHGPHQKTGVDSGAPEE